MNRAITIEQTKLASEAAMRADSAETRANVQREFAVQAEVEARLAAERAK